MSTVKGVSIMGGVSRWLPRFPSIQFRLPNLNPFGRSDATPPLGGQDEGNRESTFADRDIRRLQDGTLELFRNLEDGTTERITIIDERLFPTISGLAHEDIVLIASAIADTMFDIGSDTDTYTNTDASSEEDEQKHGDNLTTAIEPIPMQYNPWAVDSGLLMVE
ncbi:hypothetical protein B0O99DRAFT_636591 [Bisporella sp. PMI_857]|nr:hypothetical protein B0O99DRAFT_636591 [Bisporella sp. PMI_857]